MIEPFESTKKEDIDIPSLESTLDNTNSFSSLIS